jgi:hypothetical protein
MTHLTACSLAAACAALSALALSTAAEAQTRRAPLAVTVEGRSFLDAGRIAPVGTYNRHLTAANMLMSPSFGDNSGLYGRETLPPMIGAGENPFANSFFGPSLR